MKRDAPCEEPEAQPSPKKLRLTPVPRTLTTVVRIRRQGGVVVQDCDVYIGRPISRGGWDLPASKWANPFPVVKCGTAEEAVRRFEEYIKTKPELLSSLHELKGKVLGCWCKLGPCHGDVLAALCNAEDKGDE